MEADHPICRHVFDKPFKVVTSEDEVIMVEANVICVHTDASKSEDGVEIGVFSKDLEISLSFSLQEHASVFQAEVQAICVGAKHISDMKVKDCKICFFSDSKSALAALGNCNIKSKTVYDCISSLSSLGLDNEVTLHWVQGHNGNVGNETADQLAKEACSRTDYDETVYYGLDIVKREIREWLIRQHFRIWCSEKGSRTAKKLLGPTNKNSLNDALKLTRRDLSILIGALTGHMSINSFLVKLNLSNSKFCRFCSTAEETMAHILCDCKSLCAFRHKHFKEDVVNIGGIRKQRYLDLVGFIKDIGIL